MIKNMLNTLRVLECQCYYANVNQNQFNFLSSFILTLILII